jgi:uncharacterized protein (DUF362 family)
VQEIKSLLETITGQAHAEGGWPYLPGQPPRVEPTCLALLALADAPTAEAVRTQAQDVLRTGISANGMCRLAGDREEATWLTALALFTHNVGSLPGINPEPMVNRLLSIAVRRPDTKQSEEVHDINQNLRGWPWAENNFPWVEPTAWACLALRQKGQGDHPRVQEGLRLLLDRAFDEGGINYGNRIVLGKRLDPIPGPTALMLFALQGYGREPRVAASVQWLLQQALTTDDVEHLSWAKLALDCHRDQPRVADSLPAIDERIHTAYESRLQAEWLSPSVLRASLAALALNTETKNYFRLTDSDTAAKPLNGNGHTVDIPAGLSTHRPLSERIRSGLRGLAINAVGRLRQTPPQTAVHIARADDYNGNLADVLQRQYQHYRDKVPLNGKRVVLKPNLVEYHRNKVINTNPHIVAAVIELCQREGTAEVVVAEGPGHWRNVEYLAKESGLADVIRHYKVKFIDLNHDEPVRSINLGRLTGLEYLYMTRTILSSDVLISLPKLKTHHWAGATLSLKNLFGTLPGICYGWPKNELHWRGIDNSIIDIALTRPPDLEIVDGVVGMEGDGPLNGTPKHVGALIMGTDPVAVDATCCRLMQLDPEKIKYLILGYQKKLGLLRETEIQQLGESIASLAQPFDTVTGFKGLQFARSA